MRVIISPAKKMRVDRDSFSCRDLPRFLQKTDILLERLRGMSEAELQKLWKCNDKIASENIERLQRMELRSGLTPAIYAYEGIQYQYMCPNVFTDEELEYIQEHLRIISGFYGILRPFDGVTPYRLEMQAKLPVGDTKDLYGFWESEIAEALFSETDCVINLASKEYSQCVFKYLPKTARMITCVFGEKLNGKIVEKGTMCKMARGEMVRFMAEQRIRDPEQLKEFGGLGYTYSAADSENDRYVFLKNTKEDVDEACFG